MFIQSVQSNTSKPNDNLPSLLKIKLKICNIRIGGEKNGGPLILGKSLITIR